MQCAAKKVLGTVFRGLARCHFLQPANSVPDTNDVVHGVFVQAITGYDGGLFHSTLPARWLEPHWIADEQRADVA